MINIIINICLLHTLELLLLHRIAVTLTAEHLNQVGITLANRAAWSCHSKSVWRSYMCWTTWRVYPYVCVGRLFRSCYWSLSIERSLNILLILITLITQIGIRCQTTASISTERLLHTRRSCGGNREKRRPMQGPSKKQGQVPSMDEPRLYQLLI